MKQLEKHTNRLYFVGLFLAILIFIYYHFDSISSFFLRLDPILMVFILPAILGIIVLISFLLNISKNVEKQVQIQAEQNRVNVNQPERRYVDTPSVQELNIGMITGIRFGFGFALGVALAVIVFTALFSSFMLTFISALVTGIR